MKMFIRFCHLFVFIIYIFPLYSQITSNDSLLFILSKASTNPEKIETLRNLASLQLDQNINLALSYTNEMLSLIEKEPEEERENYYSEVAILLLNCNVYDQAFEYFFKSLRISEKLGKESSICITNHNIGCVYFQLEKYDEALKYFNKVVELAKKLIPEDKHLEESQHSFYNNIGMTYGKLGKYNIGLRYMEKAIAHLDKNSIYTLARYYGNIAPMYYATGKRDKAFECAFKSKAYLEDLNNNDGLAEIHLILSKLYFQENDFRQARKTIEKATELAEKIKSDVLLKEIYEHFILLSKKENRFQETVFYLEKLHKTQDKLINERVLSKITSLKLHYDFEKKEAQQQLELQKTRFRHRLALTVAALFIVILLLLYFLVKLRIKHIKLEKMNLEKDLEIRNKELTTNVMYLMKNADLINEVLHRLIKLKSNLKPENTPVVKEIIQDLQSLSRNDLWKEFEVRFNRVHLDFYKNLQERCSELTPTELKLCAFLRLNMSSKEISSLTGITPKSVDVMRGRIRKKLNITNTDINLVTFLSDF